MAFAAKHLPDKFYLERDQRVSLRSKIFREIVGNMIVHREYTNAFPCTFIIYGDRVETVNANNPHGYGPIDLNNFAPFAKNPALAKFFIQIGRMDELGSGVLNVNRLIREYTPDGKVEFIEGVTFKTIVYVSVDEIFDETEETNSEIVAPIVVPTVAPIVAPTVAPIVRTTVGTIESVIVATIKNSSKRVTKKLTILLSAIIENEGKRIPIYKEITGLSSSIERYVRILKEANLIEFKGKADKIGGYYLTEKMKKILKTNDRSNI
jgi:ATP-dependent DNA helicase RecG